MNGMKSRKKCSFQFECGFEITISVSNCWWSILRTATLDKPSIKTICHFSILMTIVFFVCNVAKLVSSIFNVTIIFSFNIATGLLRTSSWFWAFEAVPSCNSSWNKSEKLNWTLRSTSLHLSTMKILSDQHQHVSPLPLFPGRVKSSLRDWVHYQAEVDRSKTCSWRWKQVNMSSNLHILGIHDCLHIYIHMWARQDPF